MRSTMSGTAYSHSEAFQYKTVYAVSDYHPTTFLNTCVLGWLMEGR
jgi:hypothetical protein